MSSPNATSWFLTFIWLGTIDCQCRVHKKSTKFRNPLSSTMINGLTDSSLHFTSRTSPWVWSLFIAGTISLCSFLQWLNVCCLSSAAAAILFLFFAWCLHDICHMPLHLLWILNSPWDWNIVFCIICDYCSTYLPFLWFIDIWGHKRYISH